MDEFGPIEVKPELGQNWRPEEHPDRVPATYSRTEGVQHLFAALDLERDKIYAHIKPRKRWNEFLQFLKYLRSLYPLKEILYKVLDNFSLHKKEEVLNWADSNNIKLFFTPTNASWLNRIECHYTPIKKFALQNSNYRSKKEQASPLEVSKVAFKTNPETHDQHPKHY